MTLAREKPPCCICGKTSARDGYCPRHAHIHEMQVVLDVLTDLNGAFPTERIWRAALTSGRAGPYRAVARAIRRLHHEGFLRKTPTGTGKAALWRPV